MNKYLKQNLRLIIVSNALTLAVAFLLCAFPILIDYVLNNYQNFELKDILFLMTTLFGSILLIVLTKYFLNITRDKLAFKVKKSIRNDIFKKLLLMNYNTYNSNDLEYYVNLESNELDAFYEAYYESVIFLISAIVQVVVFFAVMIITNWILGLVAVGVSICCAFIPKLVGKKLDEKRKTKIKNNEIYLAKLLDFLKGKDLIATNENSGFIINHSKANDAKSISEYKFNKYYSFINVFSDISTYLVMFLVLSFGLIFVHFDYCSIGSLLSIYLVSTYLLQPLCEILYYMIAIKSSKPYIDSYFELIGYNKTKFPKKYFSEINIKNLLFKRDTFVLKIDNLKFEKGKHYAIIGKNGVGKSTFLSILLKKIDDFSGTILVDGENYQLYDLENYFNIVNQNNYVFNGSVEENITFFGTYPLQVTENDLKSIDLGLNFSQLIGSDGECISGGEKGKISLLRCLNKNAPFIILDEAFSAIDNRSKKKIKDYIFKNKDFGIIEITHDISENNFSYYDQIILFRKGKNPLVFRKKEVNKYSDVIEAFENS